MPDPGDDLFRALADPTRRRILDLLAERGTLTVGQLAAEFPDLVSSGISKHLMGLRAAGLVAATRRGRQRLYRVNGDALAAALAPWLARYEQYWSGALERLRALSEGRRPSRRERIQRSAEQNERTTARRERDADAWTHQREGAVSEPRRASVGRKAR